MNRLGIYVFAFLLIIPLHLRAESSDFNPSDAIIKVGKYILHPVHEKIWEKFPTLKNNQQEFTKLWFSHPSMPSEIVFKQFQESWLDKKNPLGSWSIAKREKNGSFKVVGLIGFRNGSNKGFNYVGGMTEDGKTSQFYWAVSPNYDDSIVKIIKKVLQFGFKNVKNLKEVWLGTFASQMWGKILNVYPNESQEIMKDQYSLIAMTPQEKIPLQAEKAGFHLFNHYPFKIKSKVEKEQYIAVYIIDRDKTMLHKEKRNWWSRLKSFFM